MPTCTLAVIAHNVRTPLSLHRSEEFRQRVEFLSKVFGRIHILSWDMNSGAIGETLRASEEHNVFVTRLNAGFLKNQILAYTVLRKHEAVLVDTQSDLFRLMPALIVSRIKTVLLRQGFVLDQFLSTLREKHRLRLLMASLLLALLERISFRICTKVVTVSRALERHTAGIIGQGWRKKVRFLPHALSYVLSPLTLSEHALEQVLIQDELIELEKIVYVGRLVDSKRVDVVLRAFRILKRKHNVVLIVVGDGEARGQLERISVELGISNQTFFMGQLSRADAISVLRRSSVMVFPSISEGFGLAIYESLAVGCPVVAYRFRGASYDGLDQAAILLDSLDPEEYALAADRLLSDWPFKQSQIERGMKIASKYVRRNARERCAHLADLIIE